MKVRCDTKELADAVGDVLGIIPATQATKPIFLDFHLSAGEDGLVVQATDLDMGARVILERAEVLEGGELTVPASRFHSVVRELPDRAVMIEALPDARGALIQANGYEFKMLGNDPREFPELPPFTREGAVSAPREGFVEMLRRVAIAACRDTARFQLTGVFLEVGGDRLTLTATDGKRLTNDFMYVSNQGGKDFSAIIPNRVVDVLLKVLAQGDAEFSFVVADPNFQAKFSRGELTAKVIQATYPEYRVAIPTEINVRVTAKRIDLLAAARTASLMTDKNTAAVLFRFEEGKACLNTHASSIGESRIEIPIRIEGDPIEIRFNPTYLVDALRCIMEEEVRIEFSDAEKPGAVRAGENYRHLVMPVITPK